jgi:hypothetical protein
MFAKESSAHVKALVYVWLAASLEAFIGEALRALLRELTALAVPQHSISLSLLSISCFPVFDALRDIGGLKGWERRVELLHRSTSADIAVFADEKIPLDGRTIRPTHLNTVWIVFGLPGSALPSPQHALALNDLADGRNKIAHGRETPLSLGRRKATADILRIADYAEEIAIHIALNIDQYLSQQLYLR